MKKSFVLLAASAITIFTVVSSQAQVKTDSLTNKKAAHTATTNPTTTQDTSKAAVKGKVVGGAQMLPTKDIVDNASQAKDLTTLVSALKTAGLADTLKSAGPFTVFAPTNDAFAKLPAGKLDSLNKASNKEKLTDVLEYHVVPGKLTSRDLAVAVAKGKGTAKLTTVEGESLNVTINAEKNLQISDAKGNIALVTQFDVEQSNGIVHVINNVLLPKQVQ
jgi:uncharacterized surface protein with fasciclin (FAS1) repeats